LGRRDKKASTASLKPLARSDDLVVEELGDELLIYDNQDDRAHSLGSEAARVFRACDGETDVDAMSAGLDLDPDTVSRALLELEESGLLDVVPGDGITRRMATKKMAKLGAAAASAPLIYSIVAPAPALAATQQFCLNLGCQNGCGGCHQAGCSCCGPGRANNKICTQDCSDTNCNTVVFNSAQCGQASNSVACNS
jgi:DNA-binding transcriptional ArsR family regulator